MSGLVEAATAILSASERKLEVAAHNVANVSTPGFKRQIGFSQLLQASGNDAMPLPEVAVRRNFAQGKLTETRKYYQMYNTLDDTLTFLTKEISILNSIHDNFKNALKSAALKTTFLEQLQNIVNSVDGYMKRVRIHCKTRALVCELQCNRQPWY